MFTKEKLATMTPAESAAYAATVKEEFSTLWGAEAREALAQVPTELAEVLQPRDIEFSGTLDQIVELDGTSALDTQVKDHSFMIVRINSKELRDTLNKLGSKRLSVWVFVSRVVVLSTLLKGLKFTGSELQIAFRALQMAVGELSLRLEFSVGFRGHHGYDKLPGAKEVLTDSEKPLGYFLQEARLEDPKVQRALNDRFIELYNSMRSSLKSNQLAQSAFAAIE